MKNSKKIVSIAVITVMLLPVLVLAVYTPVTEPGGGISDINAIIGSILSLVWKIFIGLAVLMIIIAGFFFVTSQGAPEKIQTARSALIWAVAGIVVAIIAYSIPLIIKTVIGG